MPSISHQESTGLQLHSSQKILHTYIFVIGINFPKKKYNISVTRKYFPGINFPKITYHVFFCDLENYMEKLVGLFLGKISFQLHEVMFSEIVRNNFRLECMMMLHNCKWHSEVSVRFVLLSRQMPAVHINTSRPIPRTWECVCPEVDWHT